MFQTVRHEVAYMADETVLRKGETNMDARLMILSHTASHISEDRSADRASLSRVSEHVFGAYYTLKQVGGGISQLSSISKYNTFDSKTGLCTGVFCARPVFFALFGACRRSVVRRCA